MTQKSCQQWEHRRLETVYKCTRIALGSTCVRSAQGNSTLVPISLFLSKPKWRGTRFFPRSFFAHPSSEKCLYFDNINHYPFSPHDLSSLVVIERNWIKILNFKILFVTSLEQKFYRNYFVTFWLFHIFNQIFFNFVICVRCPALLHAFSI